jgi:predicted DCC family thiol-disulfide oxidoreductase YuxK
MLFYNKLKNAFEKKIDGTGLAVFRVGYGLVLLGEIIQMYYFRHLIFDQIPYLLPGPINPSFPLIFWMAVVVLLILGMFTPTVTIVNYIFSLVIFGVINSFEYHMFYAYMGMNFLLMFMPVSQCLSIDRLRLKLKYSNTRVLYTPPSEVSSLAYLVPVFICVGFVYFDSIFFKLDSYNWMHGLGMWLPSSLPMITHMRPTVLLNYEWLMKLLGYLTLVFELVFIFLFWYRWFRVPLLIIGVGLHLGILVEYPIPWFALGVSGIYLLMVPVKWWRKIFARKESGKNTLKVYYDRECPLCTRVMIISTHFDVFRRVKFLSVQEHATEEKLLQQIDREELYRNIYSTDRQGRIFSGLDTYIRIFNHMLYLAPFSWIIRIPGIYQAGKKVYSHIALNRTTERCTEDSCGFLPVQLPPTGDRKVFHNLSLAELKAAGIYAGLFFLILFQINVTYNSQLITKVRQQLNIDGSMPGRLVAGVSFRLSEFSKAFLGITSHGVFMDSHFNGYNHIISVAYVDDSGRRIPVPIINEDGTPGPYIYGANWVKWTFRVNAPQVNMEELERGIRDFSAFWAFKNGINLENAVFEIRVKKIEVPRDWEKDFLLRQMSGAWIPAGKAIWENRRIRFEGLMPIENI